DVEEWLCTRGVIVTYAVIQQWCRKFGQAYANQLRRRRPRPGDKWYLDEVLLTTKGVRHYLWFWRVRSHQRVGAQGLRRHSHLSWATQFVLHVTLSLSVLLCGGIQTPAQERLGVEPPQRLGPVEPPFPTPQAPPLGPPPALPPLPAPPSEQPERLPTPRVFVQHIRVTGSTVFSNADLAAVTNVYVNSYVTSEDLEALRLALTRLYVNAGYINSGAVLPDQTVTEGVITFHIIEGTLTRATVDGNRWFHDSYLLKRFTLDVKPPLNIGVLQERLQLMQQDERIERLNAELRPGAHLGEGELALHVVERSPIPVALEFNNYQSPSVGAERGLITVADRNVTGNGDILNFTYGRSAGLDLQIDTSYTLPLSPRETTA